MQLLSAHFSLEELTRSDTAARLRLDNTPPPAALANLTRLAAFLERVRALLPAGSELRVNSAYRSVEVNDAVGGVRNSQHLQGLAADVETTALPNKRLFDLIKGSGLLFDQLLLEHASDSDGAAGWVHVSIPHEGLPARRWTGVVGGKGVTP